MPKILSGKFEKFFKLRKILENTREIGVVKVNFNGECCVLTNKIRFTLCVKKRKKELTPNCQSFKDAKISL